MQYGCWYRFSLHWRYFRMPDLCRIHQTIRIEKSRRAPCFCDQGFRSFCSPIYGVHCNHVVRRELYIRSGTTTSEALFGPQPSHKPLSPDLSDGERNGHDWREYHLWTCSHRFESKIGCCAKTELGHRSKTRSMYTVPTRLVALGPKQLQLLLFIR